MKSAMNATLNMSVVISMRLHLDSVYCRETLSMQKPLALMGASGFLFAMEVRKMCIPTIDMVMTGKNIKNLRKQSGITITALQQVFGFSSPQAIFKWQRGDNLPTIDNLVVLAALFNVPVDDILVVNR